MTRKKALVLFGSPHKNGKTARLLNFYLSSLKDFEVKQVDVFDLKFEFCRDCGYCKTNEDCIYDDLKFLEKLYEEADLLVIASPIHNSDISAPLKALLDRTQKYFYARFFRNVKSYFSKSKKVCLILTADCLDYGDVIHIKTKLEHTFSIMNASFSEIITSFGTQFLT